MFHPPSAWVCAAVLAIGSVQGDPALAQSPLSLDHCFTLYMLWARYESHFAHHTGQRARAHIALEDDCVYGRHSSGVEELERLLRRGLIPIPDDDSRKPSTYRPSYLADAPSSSPSRDFATLRSAVSKPSRNWE